jgi:hypothetical protein
MTFRKIDFKDEKSLEDNIGKFVIFPYLTYGSNIEGKLQGVRKSRNPFRRYPVISVFVHWMQEEKNFYTGRDSNPGKQCSASLRKQVP